MFATLGKSIWMGLFYDYGNVVEYGDLFKGVTIDIASSHTAYNGLYIH
ncbi:MAG: hypothetical protein ACLU4J_11305 [Butyricimonas paravirosa]